MKIYFFTKGDITMASSRFRVHIMAKKLSEQGIETHVHVPRIQAWWDLSTKRFRELSRTLHILTSTHKQDVVYLHKTVFQIDFIIAILVYTVLRRFKIIFDFDDAIFLHSRIKTILLLKVAAAVTVASHYNLDFAKKYNAKSFLLPTVVQHEVYKKYTTNYKPSNPPSIGWIGNARGHYDNLVFLKTVLDELSKHNTFTFTLIGAKNNQRIHELFSNTTYPVQIIDNLDWSDEIQAPRHIQRFSIGVMPLLDTSFNRGKASFKALEYMACGVPVVASAVGENNFVIQHNNNGILATTKKEWVEALKELLGNQELQKKIGMAGQKTIQSNYSFEVITTKLIKIIKHIY